MYTPIFHRKCHTTLPDSHCFDPICMFSVRIIGLRIPVVAPSTYTLHSSFHPACLLTFHPFHPVCSGCRVFLVEKCMATVISGLESLCKEVEKRGFESKQMESDAFNPISFLAQFLMRNNPR